MPFRLFQYIHTSQIRRQQLSQQLIWDYCVLPLEAGVEMPLYTDGFPAMAFLLDAGMELAFTRNDQAWNVTDAWISSPYLQETMMKSVGNCGHILIVRFNPIGFYQFSKMLPSRLRQQPVWEPTAVLGTAIRPLLHKLSSFSEEEEKVKTVINWLQARPLAPDANALLMATLQEMAHEEVPAIRQLTISGKPNYKWLERNFTRYLGIAPKEYLRQQRFLRAGVHLTTTSKPDYLALAVHHGYYDQQHLIKDFRKFSGITPTHFFAANLLKK